MKRDPSLDVLRCGMNYMIVLLHAWAAFQYVEWDTFEFKFWTFVCSHMCWMALPCFFFISGYLLFRGFTLAAWPEKIWRRVKRLAVPYVVWNVTFVVFYVVAAHFVPRLATRVSTFGLDTFQGAFSKVLSFTVHPIDGPLWFLRVVFLLTLASPLIYWLMKKLHGIPLFGACISWIVAEPALGLSSTLEFTAPAYAIVCFSAGGWMSVNAKDIRTAFRPQIWLPLGMLACVIRAVILMPITLTSIPLLTSQQIIVSVLAVLEVPAFLSLLCILPAQRIVEWGAFKTFNDMSFFAYAGHFLFCSMLLHTVAPVLASLQTGKMSLLVTIFFVGGVGLMVMVYYTSRKLLPQILRFYDGNL